MGYWLWVMSYGLWVVGWGLWVIGYKLWVVGLALGLRIWARGSLGLSYRLNRRQMPTVIVNC